jgi:hypothetical protein
MVEILPLLASSNQRRKKLIMVLEQDRQVGNQFVQVFRQETPFQAVLATSLSEARNLLGHLRCDLLLLTDGTFPEADLECLYVLPGHIEPPDLLSVTFLSETYNYRDERDVKSMVKAVKLFLAVRDASPGVLAPLQPALL